MTEERCENVNVRMKTERSILQASHQKQTKIYMLNPVKEPRIKTRREEKRENH